MKLEVGVGGLRGVCEGRAQGVHGVCVGRVAWGVRGVCVGRVCGAISVGIARSALLSGHLPRSTIIQG